jgi:hypothetical protein
MVPVPTQKIAGRVTKAVNAEIDAMATELGMGKTAFVSLCIMSGFQSVKRMFKPETAISQEAWIEILRAADILGKLPETLEFDRREVKKDEKA